MSTESLSNYLNVKRIQAGLTYEAVANRSDSPESTVKNLFTGKTEDPRLSTVIPVMEAVGGSFDEMLHPDKNKDEIKETSILALRDVYEYQLTTLKETSEEHIRNIRAHYQQHHTDLKENYERRLNDKRELLESYKEHINATKNDKRKLWLTTCVLAAMLFSILLADVMFGNVGWIRY